MSFKLNGWLSTFSQDPVHVSPLGKSPEGLIHEVAPIEV
jgi:hypothetical protein